MSERSKISRGLGSGPSRLAIAYLLRVQGFIGSLNPKPLLGSGLEFSKKDLACKVNASSETICITSVVWDQAHVAGSQLLVAL